MDLSEKQIPEDYNDDETRPLFVHLSFHFSKPRLQEFFYLHLDLSSKNLIKNLCIAHLVLAQQGKKKEINQKKQVWTLPILPHSVQFVELLPSLERTLKPKKENFNQQKVFLTSPLFKFPFTRTII